MGFFDKKYCDICGEKIGLFGGRKLADGNMCKNCSKKLSPWFSACRESTVAEIEEQLEYREQNREDASNFHISREIGDDMKVLIDEETRTFMVTDANPEDFQDENPDVISLEEVLECNLHVEETETELYCEDDTGTERPCDPPRYEYSYIFHMQIVLDHPYLNEISFQLRALPLEICYTDRSFFGTGHFDPEQNTEYCHYMNIADEIMEVLAGDSEEEDADIWEENAVTCL